MRERDKEIEFFDVQVAAFCVVVKPYSLNGTKSLGSVAEIFMGFGANVRSKVYGHARVRVGIPVLGKGRVVCVQLVEGLLDVFVDQRRPQLE